MQVILLEKVVNLGDLGEVVRVRNGYARNFLIPRGIARRATPEAIKEIEAQRAELERAQQERLAAAQALGNQLAELRRSEEHTSELQSRFDLVCRLLVESTGYQRALLSFPTRRSSDLGRSGTGS